MCCLGESLIPGAEPVVFRNDVKAHLTQHLVKFSPSQPAPARRSFARQSADRLRFRGLFFGAKTLPNLVRKRDKYDKNFGAKT